MRGSVKRRGESWRARYRGEDGKDRQRTFSSKREADQWLRDQLGSLDAGTWVDPSAGSISFAEYAAQWLGAQHVRPTTARLHEMRTRLYINPVLGEIPLRGIRRSHVVEIVRRCSADLGLSPLVTKYAVGTLRAILESAVRDRLLSANVASDRSIALPRRERELTDVLDASDVAAITAAIEPRLRAMVVLGAATGLRSGELRAVTADRITPGIHLGALDITPRTAVIRVDRQITAGRTFGPVKSASSMRDVVVGATVVGELIAHVRAFGLGTDGLLFTTAAGEMIDSNAASLAWRRAVRGLDVPAGASWHDLRHHHASTLLSQGINVAAVARRLGHSSPTVTLTHYAHAMPTDEQRVLDASEAIALAVGGA